MNSHAKDFFSWLRANMQTRLQLGRAIVHLSSLLRIFSLALNSYKEIINMIDKKILMCFAKRGGEKIYSPDYLSSFAY